MSKMAKLIAVAVALFTVIGLTNTAKAASSDSFTITVTLQFMEIVLQDNAAADYNTWALGMIAPSSTSAMATANSYVKAELGSTNYATKIKVSAGNSDNGWTLAAAAAQDTFGIGVIGSAAAAAPTAVPDFTTPTMLTAAGVDVVNVPQGQDAYLYFKFFAPTESTTASAQAITVTVNVVAQ